METNFITAVELKKNVADKAIDEVYYNSIINNTISKMKEAVEHGNTYVEVWDPPISGYIMGGNRENTKRVAEEKLFELGYRVTSLEKQVYPNPEAMKDGYNILYTQYGRRLWM